MPLILDIIAKIDERSAAAEARQLEHAFDASAEVAGTSIGAKMVGGIAAGFQGADFDSMLGALSSGGLAAKAATHGSAIGLAFAGGITVAAAAGLVDLGVKVGETFEKINRDITLHTAATGKALDDLKAHADALVGSLDFDPSKTGTNMAILGTRLQMGIGKPLDDLTKNVGMLQDRLGNFDAGVLAGALANMGVTGANANDVLDSLTQTVQRTNIPFAQLTTDLAANSELFKDLHLTAQQGAAMLGQLSEKGIPAATAMMGLQMGMKAAAKEGEDFNTFINRISATLQAMGAAGDEAGAEKLSLAIGGPRKWTDEVAAINALQAARSSAYAGDAADLTKLDLATRTLGDEWELVKNKISSALAPPGLSVTDEIKDKMESLIGFIDAHATDLRNLFETSLNAIEATVEGLAKIGAFLGQHPGLIEAVATAFGTWEAIKGVNAVLTGLEAVGAWLVGAPAVAATSAAGVSAAAAGGAAAVTASAAGAATAATTSMGALEAASAAGLASVTAAAAGADVEVAASAAAVAAAAAESAAAVAAAAGTGVGALEAAVAAGTASVIAGAAEADAAVAAGAAVAATAVTTSMTAADAAVLSLNASLDATVATLAAIATSPAVVVLGSLAALFGLSIATGSASGQEATPDNTQAQPALGADGQPLIGPDGKPIMVGPGRAAAPSQGTGRFAPGQGPDVGGRAGPGLPGAAVVPGASGAPLSPSELSKIEGDGGPKGPRLPAPQVPYGAGYGAPPGPGESAEQYSKQQEILEKRHNIDETTARLNQLEQTENANADDIQKAKNDQLKAISEYNKADLEQTKKHASDMEQVGAKIDKDFGISKGLSGIAENLTKFLANLVAAPVFGALQGAKSALGGPTYGAGGLLGMGALGGAFGEQYTPEALAAEGARPGDRRTHTGGRYGYQSDSPGRGSGGAAGGPGASGGLSANATSSGWWGGGADSGGGAGGFTQTGPYGGPDASGQFPQWVKDIGARFHLTPSTYGGHQTGNRNEPGFAPNPGGANRGIDWNGSPQDEEGFADFARQHPGLFEQFIHNDPGSGTKTGIAGGRLVGPGTDAPGYYGSDWGGHGDHDHTRFGQGFMFPTPPSFDAGGNVASQAPAMGAPTMGSFGAGAVPIVAHEGEHVLTTKDVNAMGGQQGVYDFRAGLHGPQPSTAGGSGATNIGGLGAPKGLGSGFTVTGGGLIGVAESVPATAASMGMAAAMALYGGAVEDLPSYQDGGEVATGAGAGAAGSGPAGAGAGPAGAGLAAGLGMAPGASGLGAAGAGSSGGSGTGAGGGGAPGGSVIGAAIGIGIQEMNEAISKGSQMAGAVVGGLQQTFGMQQFAQTPLAQSGWINRIVGGIAGAQPQLPNTGGQSAGKASPEGVPGMSPMMTPPQEVSPFGPGRGVSPGPSGPPQAPAAAPQQPLGAAAPSPSAAAGAGHGADSLYGQQPSPNDVIPDRIPSASSGFNQSSNSGGSGSSGPLVHIENLYGDNPHSTATEIGRHTEVSYAAQSTQGAR